MDMKLTRTYEMCLVALNCAWHGAASQAGARFGRVRRM